MRYKDFNLSYPHTFEQHAHIKQRKIQNIERSVHNKNENWMAEKLQTTGLQWTRQAQWGFRIFDFWCRELGVAIEVDGAEHNRKYDAKRDYANYHISGIIVLRVRNQNEDDATNALIQLKTIEPWNERRIKLGLKPISKHKFSLH